MKAATMAAARAGCRCNLATRRAQHSGAHKQRDRRGCERRNNQRKAGEPYAEADRNLKDRR